MKIKELIKLLKKHPQDLEIVSLVDEFACYHPLEKETIEIKTLCLGNTQYEEQLNNSHKKDKIKYKYCPRWRDEDYFYGKCKIKKKKKMLII